VPLWAPEPTPTWSRPPRSIRNWLSTSFWSRAPQTMKKAPPSEEPSSYVVGAKGLCEWVRRHGVLRGEVLVDTFEATFSAEA
jgi:hypothetical protein